MTFDQMTHEQKVVMIQREYTDAQRSWNEIAQEFNTNSQKLRRFNKKYKVVPSRDRSEAQKVALSSGRHPHPTKDKGHSKKTKEKISQSMGTIWENMTDEELERRKQLSKDIWDSLSVDQKAVFQQMGTRYAREAGKSGSKLEKSIHLHLTERDFVVEFHKERLILNKKLQIDILLPFEKVAIEVDGPSHFLPIWGHDALASNIRADHEKNGLLLESGYIVLRIQNMSGEVSQIKLRKLYQELDHLLDGWKEKFPSKHERLFHLEV